MSDPAWHVTSNMVWRRDCRQAPLHIYRNQHIVDSEWYVRQDNTHEYLAGPFPTLDAAKAAYLLLL